MLPALNYSYQFYLGGVHIASVEKISQGALKNKLKHNTREIINNSNKDIDPNRKHLNYNFTPNSKEDAQSCLNYYEKRKSELYCYNRPDVKAAAQWVITLPQEIKNPDEEKIFFEKCYSFLEEKYGLENVIQASVHYDEGKTTYKKYKHSGDPILLNGQLQWEKTYGQPHLHFIFIPVVRIDHDSLKNRKHPKAMDNYDYKIALNAVLTKSHLQNFHAELSNYLSKNGINAKVVSGITKKQGGNKTVKELKRSTDLSINKSINLSNTTDYRR